MRWYRKGLLLLFAFFHVSAGQSQNATDFQKIGVDQGLSQNSVYSMYQDSRGFLWIGTADGLNRYDGKTIKTYKSLLNISEPFNANFIRGNMDEDEKGNIWYTSEDGLYMYDRQLDKVIPRHVFKKNEIGDFKLSFISREGKVWMFQPYYGFASFDIASNRFEGTSHNIDIENEVIVSPKTVTPDRYENLWYSVKKNSGLHRFNTKTGVIDKFFALENLTSIQFTKGGHYRIGLHAVSYFDSASQTLEALPIRINTSSVQPLSDVLIDHSARLWIATPQNGLWFYDPKTKQVSAYRTGIGNALPSNIITGLLLDNQENLWVSTDGAGIFKLVIKASEFESSVHLKPNLFVRSIEESENGNIVFASLENPVYVINPAKGEIKEDESVRRAGIRNVSRIYTDSRKKIWIARGNSIALLGSEKNIRAEWIFSDNPTHEVFQFYELQSGEILAGTTSGLLFFSQRNGKVIKEYVVDVFQAAAMLEDADGLWIGAQYHGLNFLKKSAKGNFEVVSRYFPNLTINSIHQDGQNSALLWLATAKGLVRFNKSNENHTVFTEADGMGNNYIYGILEDSQHRLWFSSNGGLTCFYKFSNSFINYTNKDGLQSNEFNTGSFHKGASGTFYFGGINGLNWFKPEEVTSTRQPPPVSITEIFVNDVIVKDSILQTGQLRLRYHENDLLIRFSVFDFTRPESNKVKYQLIGVDDKPHVSSSNEVTYNNLSPGNYRFEFSASNTSNIWSRDQTITLFIGTPFWKQIWFYILVTLSASGLIILITWLVLRGKYITRIADLEKLRAIDEERQRISREMHDDIGAGLTQISLMSESVRSKTNGDITELGEIADTSRKLVSNIGEIVWSLNPENKTIQQVIVHMREQFHNQLEHTGLTYSITLPENLEHIVVNNEQRKNLLLISKEIVHNAIKHSRAKNIVVEGKYADSTLHMKIQDDGIGFNTHSVAPGNGLKNIRSRINQMNGILKIDSSPGQGTVFSWWVTIPKTAPKAI